MIDLHELRENPDAYQTACTQKGIKLDIRSFLEVDERLRALKTEVEGLRASQNAFSKEIAKISGAEKETKLAEMKDLAARLKDQGVALKTLEDEHRALWLRLPSIPLSKVPVGRDDSENVEIRKWGTIPEFKFKPLDHAELGRRLDIIDMERGAKIAGARNYFLKGDGARIVHAIMSLAMDVLHQRGYILMDPPHIVKYDAMMGTSYFPGGEEQAYHLDNRDDDRYLIGTSEVSVCSYHADEILELSELPRRYAGYSPCYRREAGTYGKDTAGIYRVHQFYKVEQVIFCRNDAEESARMHAELLKNSEDVMQMLGLPYRVVDVCTGDMGQGQLYKNDIEAWMPSRNSYGETHSCSTFGDFQSRRLAVRYKGEDGRNHYCHTLNNTCVASTRLLIALLEINQNEDGSVTIPAVLRPYMGGQETIVPRKK